MLKIPRLAAGVRRIALAAATVATLSSYAGSTLNGSMALYPGQSISSQGSQYTLVMQSSGRLAYYRNIDGSLRWKTATTDGAYSVMQQDGNFVLYTSGAVPRFNTGTQGNSGAYLAAQPDGNLVVYNPKGLPLWNIGPDPIFAFSLIGLPPNLPSGTQPLGVSYSTGVTLRKNLEGPLRYFTDIDFAPTVGAFFAANGTIIPYSYNFEIIKTSGGADSRLYIVPDEVKDLTGITGVSAGAVLFPAGADHSWNIPVRGLSGASTGTVSYKLVFRIYDTKCSVAKTGYPNESSCIAYEVPLQSSTVTWTPPAAPLPAAPRVYPMVNNRPGDRNPPSTLPTTSGWPACSTGPSGQNCSCPTGGCQ